MKTKAKLVLALSVLTAGTAVAGATGTFAWFTTNRSATLTYSKISAYNTHGNLEVEIHKLSDQKATEVNNAASADGKTQASHTVTGSADSKTTDISSQDGVKLVKPIWKGESGEGKEAEKVVDAAKDEYVVYYFLVKNTGDTALNVFLDNGTKIEASTAATDADVKLANYSRVAINDFGTSAPGDTYNLAAKNTKLFENNQGNTGKYLAGITEGKATSTAVSTEAHFVGADVITATTSSTATDNNQFLVTLAKDAVEYFTVTVWLEGTKADGTDFNACAGGSINVDIVLAAYEVAA